MGSTFWALPLNVTRLWVDRTDEADINSVSPMSSSPDTRVLEILSSMLMPLARFCVKRAITIQDFEECAKNSFLRAADDECVRKGETSSMSRLSAMTGLHRRDVARIHVRGDTKDRALNVPMRVIGLWLTDRRYVTKSGQPRTLTCGFEGSDFSNLVASVSQNIHAGSVLAELERFGIVRQSSGKLKLVVRGYQPTGDSEEILRCLSLDCSDLFNAVEENLESKTQPAPHLHATTEFDSIPIESVEKIRRWILRQGALFHHKVRKYLAQYDQQLRQRVKPKDIVRVSVGTFSYVSTQEEIKEKSDAP